MFGLLICSWKERKRPDVATGNQGNAAKRKKNKERERNCRVDVIEPLGSSLKSFGYEARSLGSCEPSGALCKANTHFLLHFLSASVCPSSLNSPG